MQFNACRPCESSHRSFLRTCRSGLGAVLLCLFWAVSDKYKATDATPSEQLATERFKTGLVSYLDVITAQQAVLFNERTSTLIAEQRMLATVVPIKALGGGWTRS